VFDVALYTGNGSTQSITGLAFSPDFVWYKSRVSGVFNHGLFDIIRGAQNFLASNSAAAEQGSIAGVSAFNSDGFTLGSDAGGNTSAASMVAWAWDAGTSTVSNTAGSINSQVRANATAGFSVVTYTGTGANATVGHGLGVEAALLLVKKRSAGTDWAVYHTSLGGTKYLRLNGTLAATTDTMWNNTSPTSSVFSFGKSESGTGTGDTYVAYCFAPVVGYSSFGSYTGNGLADGPFVYTGFRPKFVLIKRTDTAAEWIIWDSSRKAYNFEGPFLLAESSAAEGSDAEYLDFLSNGFKLRTTNTTLNTGTSIYIAFAEAPFNYSRAR